jgi:excisionase family DNA binding protein
MAYKPAIPSLDDSERAAKATAAQERTRLRHARRAKIAARVERLTYSVEEVSVMLGRDPATIHRWVKSGAIASVKIGGARMIPAAELKRITGQEGTSGSAR